MSLPLLDAELLLWLDTYGDAVVQEAASRYPAMFAKMYRDGDIYGIDKDDLAARAGTAWDHGGTGHLNPEEWHELFDLAGYREDDWPADRPTTSLVLWRGAVPEHRASWSWTETRDAAIQYASGWVVQEEVGLVWRATVEPGRLLGKLNFSGYCEFIVDTEGLEIEPDGMWCRCRVDLEPFRGGDQQSRVALDLHELVLCPRR